MAAPPPPAPAGTGKPQLPPHLVQLMRAAKEASDNNKNAWRTPSGALSDAGLAAFSRAVAPSAVEQSGLTADGARTAAPAAVAAAADGAPDARRASVQAALQRMSERLQSATVAEAGASENARGASRAAPARAARW